MTYIIDNQMHKRKINELLIYKVYLLQRVIFYCNKKTIHYNYYGVYI